MGKKLPQYTWISILLACLLQKIVYAIGGFNFAKSPLFSLYDVILFFIYVVIIQYVIIKIMTKRGQIKEKQ